MHSKFLSWLSVFGLLLAFVAEACAQGAVLAPGVTQPPGKIRATRVMGTVTVEEVATKAVRRIKDNDEVSQGSVVKTAQSSSVVLLFSNGASISLAANSELNIEQFTQDPFGGSYEPSKATEEPSISNTNLRLARGELVGNVKKLKTSAGSKFTVGTPVGAAGIRGTTFLIRYIPTGIGLAFNFSILTVEGNVEVLLSTGTVVAPPVAVTDNQQIVINNVTVNPATNELVVVTPGGQTTVLNATPPTTNAQVTDIQQVQANAQQIAQALLNVSFAGDPSLPAAGANTSAPNETPGSPGGTTPNQRITPGAGG